MITRTVDKRALPMKTSTTSKAKCDSKGRNAALWGAVALQQHLSRQLTLKGFSGLNASLPQPHKLSLAQKMGLVECPPPPPTEQEWHSVVEAAAGRGEAFKPCSICYEPFSYQCPAPQQVITSCGHVFHHKCLQQFEKFVRQSGMPCACPVCRNPNYHKRVHYESAAQVQVHAATKIQSTFRGHRARRTYLRMKLDHNPKFHSDYYYAKLKNMADAYLTMATSNEAQVDRFLQEIDVQRQRARGEMMTGAQWKALREKTLGPYKNSGEGRGLPHLLGVRRRAQGGWRRRGGGVVRRSQMPSCCRAGTAFIRAASTLLRHFVIRDAGARRRRCRLPDVRYAAWVIQKRRFSQKAACKVCSVFFFLSP